MTLSQAAVLTKQVITITILAVVLGLASFIGYKIWYGYYLAHLPPKQEKPDTKFGMLPLPDFPSTATSSAVFSYSIDTTTGGLPKLGVDKGFDKLIKVYFVVKTYASLLASEKSQALAQKFNLNVDPQIISATDYLFADNTKSLNIDLDSGNFTYQNTATVSGRPALDNDNKLLSDFKTMLSTIGVSKPDLTAGPSKIVYLRGNNGKFDPTDLRSEANAAQIQQWPAPIDNKPIVTDQLNSALVNATVFNAADRIENYLALNFTYYQIDTTTFATYPVKTPDSALEDLKSGKGIVVIQPPKQDVSITSVYLAYFLSRVYTPYLIPVYVFEGPGFAAYVPAIPADFQS